MWKYIKVLEDHSNLFTMCININIFSCNIYTFENDLSTRWFF